MRGPLTYRLRRRCRQCVASCVAGAAQLVGIAFLASLNHSFLSDLWNAVSDVSGRVTREVKEFVVATVETLVNVMWGTFIKPIYDTITGVAGYISGTVTDLARDLWGAVTTIYGKIAEGISKAIGWASENIIYWYNRAKDAIEGAAGWLTGQVGALWGEVRGLADTIYHKFIEPIWHHLEGLPDWIYHHLIEPVWSGIGGLASKAWEFVQPFVKPYLDWIDGIKATISEAWTLARKLWDALWPIVSNPVGWLETKLHEMFGSVRNPLVQRITAAIADDAEALDTWLARFLG